MIKKIVSTITLACFLGSFVIGDPLYAAVDPKNNTDQFKKAIENSIIPASCGRITDSFVASCSPVSGLRTPDSPLVINIQDLHCNPEVQRNISSIIGALDSKYGLKKVYVEGGYGNVSTCWLCNVQDESVKKEIADGLLEQGRLTGTEYYSATAGRPGLLKGIEDKKLHQQNLVRLGKIVENKLKYQSKIKELNKDLAFIKAKYLSSKNRDFNHMLAQHRKGELGADKYYIKLAGYIETIHKHPKKYNNILDVTMADYPHIAAYMEHLRLGKEIRYKKVPQQLAQFMRLMKANVSFSVYNELAEKTSNFSKQEELYFYLAALAKGPALAGYRGNLKDLYAFFDYVENNQNINPLQLIEEEKRMVADIRLALSRDKAEIEVSFAADFFTIFQDYLFASLSADDYAYFSQNFDAFQKIWGKYVYGNKMAELAPEFALLNDYYKANSDRNYCFLRNITELGARSPAPGAKTTPCRGAQELGVTPDSGLRTPVSILESLKNSEIVVVVTGGFHSEGLRKILRERNVSYLTVTPNITKDNAVAGTIYAELAKQQAKLFAAQSLALTLGSTDAKVISATKDKIVVELNGKEITLNRNAQNKFKLTAGTDNAGALSKEAFEEAVNAAQALAELCRDLANPLTIVEPMYRLMKAFATQAGKTAFLTGNGIIWKIASNPVVQEAINKYENLTPEDLNQLADTFQQIITGHAEQQERLAELAAHNPLIYAICQLPELVNLVKSDTGVTAAEEPGEYANSSKSGTEVPSIKNQEGEDIKNAVEQYNLGSFVSYSFIRGYSNKTYCLTTSTGKYFLKHNLKYAGDTEELANLEMLLSTHINKICEENGFSWRVPKLYVNRKGKAVTKIGIKSFMIYDYFEGDFAAHGDSVGRKLKPTAVMMNQMHFALSSFKFNGKITRRYNAYRDFTQQIKAFEKLKEDLEKISENQRSDAHKRTLAAISPFIDVLKKIEVIFPKETYENLYKQWVHCDLGNSHLMYEGDTPILIIDWEVAAFDSPAVDFIKGIVPLDTKDNYDTLIDFVANYQIAGEKTHFKLDDSTIKYIPYILLVDGIRVASRILFVKDFNNSDTNLPISQMEVTTQLSTIDYSNFYWRVQERIAQIKSAKTCLVREKTSASRNLLEIDGSGARPQLLTTAAKTADRERYLQQIPEGLDPDKTVHVRAIVSDVDSTLTPDGESPLSVANAEMICAALEKGIPVLLITGSPFQPRLEVQTYNGDVKDAVVAMDFTDSLSTRILPDIEKLLRARGRIDALQKLEIKAGTGMETATFDAAGKIYYKKEHKNLIAGTDQADIARAMAIGFMKVFGRHMKDEHMFDTYIKELNETRRFADIIKIFDRAVAEKTGTDAMFWLFDSELVLRTHNAPVSMEEVRAEVEHSGLLNTQRFSKENGFFAGSGEQFYKISRMDKAGTVDEWLKGVEGNGAVLGFGDSNIDTFLWDVSSKEYFPFYLGFAKDSAKHKGLITVLDDTGKDLTKNRGSEKMLRQFIAAHDKAPQRTIKFIDGLYSYDDVMTVQTGNNGLSAKNDERLLKHGIDPKGLVDAIKTMFGPELYTLWAGIGAPFGTTFEQGLSAVLSDLKDTGTDALFVPEAKNCHISVLGGTTETFVKKPYTETEVTAVQQQAQRSCADVAGFTAKAAGKLRLTETGTVIYEITPEQSPEVVQGINRIRSALQLENMVAPKIVHITLGRIRTQDITEAQLQKIEAVIAKHNAAQTLANRLDVTKLTINSSNVRTDDIRKQETVQLKNVPGNVVAEKPSSESIDQKPGNKSARSRLRGFLGISRKVIEGAIDALKDARLFQTMESAVNIAERVMTPTILEPAHIKFEKSYTAEQMDRSLLVEVNALRKAANKPLITKVVFREYDYPVIVSPDGLGLAALDTSEMDNGVLTLNCASCGSDTRVMLARFGHEGGEYLALNEKGSPQYKALDCFIGKNHKARGDISENERFEWWHNCQKILAQLSWEEFNTKYQANIPVDKTLTKVEFESLQNIAKLDVPILETAIPTIASALASAVLNGIPAEKPALAAVEAVIIKYLTTPRSPIPQPLQVLDDSGYVFSQLIPLIKELEDKVAENTDLTQQRRDAVASLGILKRMGYLPADYHIAEAAQQHIANLAKEHTNYYKDDYLALIDALKTAGIVQEFYVPDEVAQSLIETRYAHGYGMLAELLQRGCVRHEAIRSLQLEAKARRLLEISGYTDETLVPIVRCLSLLKRNGLLASEPVFNKEQYDYMLVANDLLKYESRINERKAKLKALNFLIDSDMSLPTPFDREKYVTMLEECLKEPKLKEDASLLALTLAEKKLIDGNDVARLHIIEDMKTMLGAKDAFARRYAAWYLAMLKKAGYANEILSADIMRELALGKDLEYSSYAESSDTNIAASLQALETLTKSGMVELGEKLLLEDDAGRAGVVQKCLEQAGRHGNTGLVSARLLSFLMDNKIVERAWSYYYDRPGIAMSQERTMSSPVESMWPQAVAENLLGGVAHPVFNWLKECRVPAESLELLVRSGVITGAEMAAAKRARQDNESNIPHFPFGQLTTWMTTSSGNDGKQAFFEAMEHLWRAGMLVSPQDADKLFSGLADLPSEMDVATAEKAFAIVRARVFLHGDGAAGECTETVERLINRLAGHDDERIEALRPLLHAMDFLAEHGSANAKEFLARQPTKDMFAARDRDAVDAILANAEMNDEPLARQAAELLVHLHIFDKSNIDDCAKFLQTVGKEKFEPAFAALNAVLATGAISKDNFQALRGLYERIQCGNFEEYYDCKTDAFAALGAFAKAGVLRPDNITVVNELLVPNKNSTVYDPAARYQALKVLADHKVVTPETLYIVSVLFSFLDEKQVAGTAGTGIIALVESGELHAGNIFLFATLCGMATLNRFKTAEMICNVRAAFKTHQCRAMDAPGEFMPTLDVDGWFDMMTGWYFGKPTTAQFQCLKLIYERVRTAKTIESQNALLGFLFNDTARQFVITKAYTVGSTQPFLLAFIDSGLGAGQLAGKIFEQYEAFVKQAGEYSLKDDDSARGILTYFAELGKRLSDESTYNVFVDIPVVVATAGNMKALQEFIGASHGVELEAKLELVRVCGNSGIGPRSFEIVKKQYSSQRRNERLSFLRGAANAIEGMCLTPQDSDTVWELYFKEALPRFGFMTNRTFFEMFLCLRRVMQPNEDLAQEMKALGITEQGEAGIRQLAELVRSINRQLFDKMDIPDNWTYSPLMMGIVGMVTGFNSAPNWGHGSKRGLDIAQFIRNFNARKAAGMVPPLKPEYAENISYTFEVRKAGKATFSNVAADAFDQFKEAILKAEEIVKQEQTPEKVLAKLKAEYAEAALSDTDKQAVANATNLIELAAVLTPSSAVITIMAAQLLSTPEYQEFTTGLLMSVRSGLSVQSVAALIEMRNVMLKDHVLAQTPDEMKRSILKKMWIKTFEEELGRIRTIEGDKLRITARPTKGVIGEMAGDLGDACYTAVSNIMEKKNLTAVALSEGSGEEEQFAGSTLLLENTVGGNPVLILRAIDPSARITEKYSTDDILEGVIGYAEDIARTIEAKTGKKVKVLAPLDMQGALSNRAQITKSAFQAFVLGSALTLDQTETFNGYDITASCYEVRSHRNAAGGFLGVSKKALQVAMQTLKQVGLVPSGEDEAKLAENVLARFGFDPSKPDGIEEFTLDQIAQISPAAKGLLDQFNALRKAKGLPEITTVKFNKHTGEIIATKDGMGLANMDAPGNTGTLTMDAARYSSPEEALARFAHELAEHMALNEPDSIQAKVLEYFVGYHKARGDIFPVTRFEQWHACQKWISGLAHDSPEIQGILVKNRISKQDFDALKEFAQQDAKLIETSLPTIAQSLAEALVRIFPVVNLAQVSTALLDYLTTSLSTTTPPKAPAPKATTESDEIAYTLMQQRMETNDWPVLIDGKIEFVPVRVKLDQDDAMKMEDARKEFRQRRPEFVRVAEEYFAQVRKYQEGEVRAFNKDGAAREISVAMVTLSNRSENLERRLNELEVLAKDHAVELVLVIADRNNFSREREIALTRLCQSVHYPVKIVVSNINNIRVNMNLGTIHSSGKYRVYLDDDVKMVGPAIPRAIKLLKDRPEIGIASLPVFESGEPLRPRSNQLKYPLGNGVYYSSEMDGMLMVVPDEIATAMPFPPDHNNDGNSEWARRIRECGFLFGYLMTPETHLIHEDVSWRSTSSVNLTNFIIASFLRYYRRSEDIDRAGFDMQIVNSVHKRVNGDVSALAVLEFFRLTRDDINDLLEKPGLNEQDYIRKFDGYLHENAFYRANRDNVISALARLYENRDTHSQYKKTIKAYGLAKVNSFLSPLRYEYSENATPQPEPAPSSTAVRVKESLIYTALIGLFAVFAHFVLGVHGASIFGHYKLSVLPQLMTQGFLSSIVATYISQRIDKNILHKTAKNDIWRILRYALTAALFFAPVYGLFVYGWVINFIHGKISQTLVNQIILSPLLFNPVNQFAGYYFKEGLSYSKSVDRLRKNSADYTFLSFFAWSVIIFVSLLQPDTVKRNLVSTVGGMIWGMFTPLIFQESNLNVLAMLKSKLPKFAFKALNWSLPGKLSKNSAGIVVVSSLYWMCGATVLFIAFVAVPSMPFIIAGAVLFAILWWPALKVFQIKGRSQNNESAVSSREPQRTWAVPDSMNETSVAPHADIKSGFLGFSRAALTGAIRTLKQIGMVPSCEDETKLAENVLARFGFDPSKPDGIEEFTLDQIAQISPAARGLLDQFNALRTAKALPEIKTVKFNRHTGAVIATDDGIGLANMPSFAKAQADKDVLLVDLAAYKNTNEAIARFSHELAEHMALNEPNSIQAKVLKYFLANYKPRGDLSPFEQWHACEQWLATETALSPEFVNIQEFAKQDSEVINSSISIISQNLVHAIARLFPFLDFAGFSQELSSYLIRSLYSYKFDGQNLVLNGKPLTKLGAGKLSAVYRDGSIAIRVMPHSSEQGAQKEKDAYVELFDAGIPVPRAFRAGSTSGSKCGYLEVEYIDGIDIEKAAQTGQMSNEEWELVFNAFDLLINKGYAFPMYDRNMGEFIPDFNAGNVMVETRGKTGRRALFNDALYIDKYSEPAKLMLFCYTLKYTRLGWDKADPEKLLGKYLLRAAYERREINKEEAEYYATTSFGSTLDAILHEPEIAAQARAAGGIVQPQDLRQPDRESLKDIDTQLGAVVALAAQVNSLDSFAVDYVRTSFTGIMGKLGFRKDISFLYNVFLSDGQMDTYGTLLAVDWKESPLIVNSLRNRSQILKMLETLSPAQTAVLIRRSRVFKAIVKKFSAEEFNGVSKKVADALMILFANAKGAQAGDFEWISANPPVWTATLLRDLKASHLEYCKANGKGVDSNEYYFTPWIELIENSLYDRSDAFRSGGSLHADAARMFQEIDLSKHNMNRAVREVFGLIAGKGNPNNSGFPRPLTTDATVTNYIAKHPVMRFIYNHNILWLGRGFVVAWVSIERGPLGAARAELVQISCAIGLKIGGNTKIYDSFIDAHKPQGMRYAQWLASPDRRARVSALANIEAVVRDLIPPGTEWTGLLDNTALSNAIAEAIVNVHWHYNLGVLIKTTVVNIGRVLTFKKPIRYSLLTTDGSASSVDLGLLLEEIRSNGNYHEDRLANELRFEEEIKKTLLGKEEAIAQLEEYNKVLKERQGKYQRGALVDLSKLPEGKEVIIVGDLHANLSNLQKILNTNDNFGKIQRGEAVIVILGDAVHREDLYGIEEMGSSIGTMQFIMQLTIQNPDGVYYVAGNHDLDIRMGPRRTTNFKMVNQFAEYENALIRQYGRDYLKLYNSALGLSPLAVLGKDFVAAHGGPVKGDADAQAIEKANPLDCANRLVEDLIWGREETDNPINEFTKRDVLDFLSRMGVPGGTLVVGHSRLGGRKGWVWKSFDGRLVTTLSEKETAGYVSFKSGNPNPDLIDVSKASNKLNFEQLKIPMPPASFIPKLAAEASLDWHVVKAAELELAVKDFGAASIDAAGRVRTEIYCMDKRPDGWEDHDWQDLGINVNGKPIWACSKEGALTVFSEGSDAHVVAQTINGAITDEPGMKGDAWAEEKLSDLLMATNSDLRSRGFVPGFIIDHSASEKSIQNMSDGSVAVSSDFFDVPGLSRREAIPVKLAELEVIRKAESEALPQNIFIRLDGQANITDFMANLEAFNKAGNGQMIVEPAVFGGISDERIEALVELARKRGVRICVDLTADIGTTDRYRALGFYGYISGRGDQQKLIRYIDQAAMRAEDITGYDGAPALRSKLGSSKSPCKILKLSELKGLLKGGDRPITDRTALAEILKTAVLSLYSANTLSENYVKNVAYSWDRDVLPAMPADTVQFAKDAKTGNVAAIKTAMGIHESGAVKTYLEKIQKEDPAQYPVLEKAFLIALAEKMFAKSRLGNGEHDCLVDGDLEVILGKDLIEQQAGALEAKGTAIPPDLAARKELTNTAEFYRKLRENVFSLHDSTKPQDINTVIALIVAYAERKLPKNIRIDQTIFDSEAVAEVLRAG